MVSEQTARRIADALERLVEVVDGPRPLRAALESIAKNTCCDRCQEAARVARSALDKMGGGF